MSSKWRFGCGKAVEVYVPRGFDYRAITVECGSTGHDGGVVQCDRCARDPRLVPPPVPEYGDDI
jgi:hypothetical protein